jgi:hypothetical protein
MERLINVLLSCDMIEVCQDMNIILSFVIFVLIYIYIIFLGMCSVPRVTFSCFILFIVAGFFFNIVCSDCKELTLIGLLQCDHENL